VTGVGGPPVTEDRDGRPVRHFSVAVSAGSMAWAWARQESAPHGATVVADHEITALGRLAQPWKRPPEDTLTFAVVLRPNLDAEDADVPWLLGGLGAAEGIDALADVSPATWWPDGLVAGGDNRPVASLLSESQLAPGRVRGAVITFRIDMESLGLDPSRRDDLLTAILGGLDRASAQLDEDPAALAAAYESRCALVGRRVKVRLRPHGETRGEVAGVDARGRLQLGSGTGMVERITVDMLRDVELV
jgi:BirA family biotin operon repressor/biotin-[acetyl-CoA-carboxylase] ligase